MIASFSYLDKTRQVTRCARANNTAKHLHRIPARTARPCRTFDKTPADFRNRIVAGFVGEARCSAAKVRRIRQFVSICCQLQKLFAQENKNPGLSVEFFCENKVEDSFHIFTLFLLGERVRYSKLLHMRWAVIKSCSFVVIEQTMRQLLSEKRISSVRWIVMRQGKL